MKFFKTLLINMPTQRTFHSNVVWNDDSENSFFRSVFEDALPLVKMDAISCRSHDELSKVPKKKKKGDISIFNAYQAFFAHIHLEGKLVSLTTFAKLYWKEDPDYFKEQTIILTSNELLPCAFDIFKFRRTFCKKILVPTYENKQCGLDRMMQEINELMQSGDFNQSHLFDLKYTTEINKIT